MVVFGYSKSAERSGKILVQMKQVIHCPFMYVS